MAAVAEEHDEPRDQHGRPVLAEYMAHEWEKARSHGVYVCVCVKIASDSCASATSRRGYIWRCNPCVRLFSPFEVE